MVHHIIWEDLGRIDIPFIGLRIWQCIADTGYHHPLKPYETSNHALKPLKRRIRISNYPATGIRKRRPTRGHLNSLTS